MAIHQVLATAAPGDAVTNTALAHQTFLRRLGPSQVFATSVHEDLSHAVHLLGDYRALTHRGSDDLLLVHVSTGAPLPLRFLAERAERVGLVYHNIAPAAAFAPYDPDQSALLELGRSELPILSRRCDFAFSSSAYNARELERLGVGRIAVVPPVTDLDGLLGAAPDDDGAFLGGLEGPVVLLVADVAPHKRHHELVNAFHVLSTYLRHDANLLLVGTMQTPRYARLVERHIDRLVLLRASLAGRVSEARLAACYRRADVFATLSEHEGFCMPLVEAMAFGLPVVARRAAAIPETTGGAALLLDDPSPELVAEALLTAIEDDRVRTEMCLRGSRQVERYRRDSAAACYLEALGRFL